MIPKTSLGMPMMHAAAPRKAVRFGQTETPRFDAALAEMKALVNQIETGGSENDRFDAADMLASIPPRKFNTREGMVWDPAAGSRDFDALLAEAPTVRSLVKTILGLHPVDKTDMAIKLSLASVRDTKTGPLSQLADSLLRRLLGDYD